jgi:co-chaperonin GroES (HSP10)
MSSEQEAPATPALEEREAISKDLDRIDEVLRETGDLKPILPRVKHVLRPRGRWVVIRPLMNKGEDQRSAGGIVLPSSNAGAQKGTIVAVDSSVVTDLTPGMVVVFSNFPQDLDAVEDLTGDRDLLLLRDEEVYAEAVPTDEMIEGHPLAAT